MPSRFLLFLLVRFGAAWVVVAEGPEIVSREQWNAAPPTGITPMVNPVPYVIIHHSYEPAACYNLQDCSKAMKSMQDYHQQVQHWEDIGYSFGAGSDGRAYEGRGWSVMGAHAPHYNNISIGICLIGDWRTALPPKSQLQITKDLIAYGVELGMVAKDYKLFGHRQVRATECPGDALFTEIQSWPNFSDNPPF